MHKIFLISSPDIIFRIISHSQYQKLQESLSMSSSDIMTAVSAFIAFTESTAQDAHYGWLLQSP